MSHTPKRLGVFGGTFDPPHIGHLILAEIAADDLGLDCVIFVPAAAPPHKRRAAVRVSAEHRLAMTERAIAGNPRFALSRVDVDRPGPHYSVDMLRLLAGQYPASALVFLVGADSLQDLPTWSRPAELIRLASLGVMRRPGVVPDLSLLEQDIPGVMDRVEWVDAPLIDIASSTIAELLASGRSIRYQVPDAVCDYIEMHGLYRKQS